MSGCSLLQVHAYPLPQLREQASVQHAPVAVQPLLELPDMDSLAPMQLQVWALLPVHVQMPHRTAVPMSPQAIMTCWPIHSGSG